MTQRSVPAVWMRGGTSKGLFFHDHHLPREAQDRKDLLLRALGSPDPYGKQMDGLGGATSSTSKVVIISPSRRADCDVDYWFGHVAIDRPVIDSSGNCGNLSAAVGPFAIDEGLVAATDGITRVRIWQANIGKRIIADVPVISGRAACTGDFEMDGVPFPGAAIDLSFTDAGGEADGSVLPTGRAVDVLDTAQDRVTATLVNAGNPAVFLRAADLGLNAVEQAVDINSQPDLLARMEALRATAAVAMGLADSPEAASLQRPATPKIHWVGPPCRHTLANERTLAAESYDLSVRALSMGQAHHAYPGTSAIATAVAAAIPGSLLSELHPPSENVLRLGHASGLLNVAASVAHRQGRWFADWVRFQRSARRLMQGEILLP